VEDQWKQHLLSLDQMVRVDTASDYEEHFPVFETFTSQIKVKICLL